MNNLKKRIDRVEKMIDQEQQGLLTADDIRLVLSCLPPDFEREVRAELSHIADSRPEPMGKKYQRSSANPDDSGLYGNTLENLLAVMPDDESRGKLKVKLGIQS